VVVSGERVKGTRHVFDATLSTPEGDREWSVNVVDLPSDMEQVWLVIGFTGEASPTGKMVAGVAQRLKNEPGLEAEMDAIARITRAGLTALSAGNMEAVGIAMDACHQKLRLIGVSSPSLEALVEAVEPHALGAKLTGAGGGGCMIALAREPQRVAEAIEIAGGRPMISKLGAPGVHLL
jgi:mevalonate kinase